MKGSKGITALSLCFIAMNLLTLDHASGSHWADGIPAVQILSSFFMNHALMILGEPLSVIIAAMLVLLGIFLLCRREIARKIFIFAQGLSILGGLCVAPVEIARWSGGENVAQHAPAIIVYAILFSIAPVIFILFFTRPKVREQFR
jgi:hypothetical protein